MHPCAPKVIHKITMTSESVALTGGEEREREGSLGQASVGLHQKRLITTDNSEIRRLTKESCVLCEMRGGRGNLKL